MPFATVAGLPVVAGKLCLPRAGNWHGDFALDAASAPTGKVQVALAEGELVFEGTVLRGGAPYQTALVRVVGGAGGLTQDAAAKFYQGVTLQNVLEDVLGDADEVLSGTVSADVLATQLPAWATIQQPTGEVLSSLALVPGVPWRMLPDGSIWLGAESWPAAAGQAGWQLLQDAPELGRQILAADVPNLLPGQTFGGRQVSYVEHRIEAGKLRAHVYYEDA